jgi:hypothetical protein
MKKNRLGLVIAVFALFCVPVFAQQIAVDRCGNKNCLVVKMVDENGNPFTVTLNGDVAIDTTTLSKSAAQTDRSQKSQLTDGTHDATPFFHLGTLYAPGFAIVDGSGNQITSFGGGTQYATGAAQATPTGTAMLWGDGTNVWTPSVTHPLPIVLPSATVTTLTPPAAITGFATAVKQPALGTAGTASTDVISIQGITSMTPIKVDPGTADGADGAAPTNPPVPVTGRARATEVAAVDAGDSLTTTESLVGATQVNVGSLPQDRWQSNSGTGKIEDTTAISVIAGTSAKYTVITNILVTNSDATVGSLVRIISGTGTVCGTNTVTLWSGYAAALGGGWGFSNLEGIFSATVAADDVCIVAATTSAEIEWSASGFKSSLKRVQ